MVYVKNLRRPAAGLKGYGNMTDIEEGGQLDLDFAKLAKAASCSEDVLPVVVQHADTLEVLVVAYCNGEALKRNLETRTVTFYSTSRDELWVKGATSGNTFELVEVRVNCEQNALLFLARPRGGGMCHTSNRNGEARNCFYRRLNLETGELENLDP